MPGLTPCVSAIVLVPKGKETDEVRICSDNRIANTAILRERHTMPTVDDLIVKLNGASVISKFDLKCGYNQILIKPSCRYITAFCTHMGIFQYKRLNFGINTAAEIFQKAVESIIAGLEGVINISDDIIVAGRDQKEHDNRLDAVLKRFNDAGMTLNAKKCEFSKKEFDFFGLHVSSKGISIQESKTETLLKTTAPKSPSELRSMIGLATYCGRFIEDLATILEPFRPLLKKNAVYTWNGTHEEALNKLKNALTTKAMAYFDPNLRSEVTVDASPVGLGLVFAQYDQTDPENTRQIIQYASKSLSDVESRYSQIEKEALGVVWACEKLHLYLYGSEFDIITDNKAVQLIFGNPTSKPKARIERWCLRLLPYKFIIKHRPGSENIADYLSRNPMSRQELQMQEDIAERYINFVSNTAIPAALRRQDIIEATQNDPTLSQVKKWIRNDSHGDLGPYANFKNELSTTADGLVLKGNRICIPERLKHKIIILAHQGHQGIVRTKQLVRQLCGFRRLMSLSKMR